MGPATSALFVSKNGHRSCRAGNFTQLPNEVYDILLPLLTTTPVEIPTAEGKRLATPAVSEISVYLTLLRLTYGWKDRRESLTVEVPPAKAAAMIGIDERSVWDAYARLEARGFIERPHRKGNRTVVRIIPIEQLVQNLKGMRQASYPSKPRGKARKLKTSEPTCTETYEVGFGGSPGASLLAERKGKEEPSSSERSVEVCSIAQDPDQTPAGPLAQAQRTNGPHDANGRRYLDSGPDSSKARADNSRGTQNTSEPSPAEVDAVRAALKQATGKDSTAGDTLPAELLHKARNHGGNAAVLFRWIVDMAESKRRQRDPVNSHGFFRRVLDEDLPGWMHRYARTVDFLTPRALSTATAPVDSIAAEEDASPGGPATASPSRCTPVSRGRPESAESWKPPKPPPPPKCPDCRDVTTVERGNETVRCSCAAGREVAEDYLRLANKLRGRQNAQSGELRPSAATPQATNGSGFKRITTEDVAQAGADRQTEKAVA